MSKNRTIEFLRSHKAATLLAWLGIGIFLCCSILNAIHLPVILDESAYMFDGYLFVTGEYKPFEPGGPYMSKMPLVYTLYGIPQALFGPTLVVGRMTAVTLGVFSMVGLWMLLKRSVKPWVATFGVWLVVLSPNMIRNFSQALSQVMVAFFLVWSLYFLLDPRHRKRSLFIGSILAVIVVLLRQNMVFYPFFVAIYAFFTQSRKTAWVNLVVMGGIFVSYHALYFPEILRLWVVYLPFGRSFFQQAGILPPSASNIMIQYMSLQNRLRALLEAITFNIVQFSAFVLVVFSTRWKKWFQKTWEIKTLIFLFLSWVSLSAIHADASLGGNYCVYCYRLYLDFFSYLLIVLVCFLLDRIEPIDFVLVHKGFAFVWLAGFSIIAGISLNVMQVPVSILDVTLPRFSGGRFLPDFTRLFTYINSLLHLEYDQALVLVRWMLPMVIFLGFLSLSACLKIILKLITGQNQAKKVFAPVLILFAALVFSYLPVFNIGYEKQACGNVLRNNREITLSLAAVTAEWDEVIWYGNHGIHVLAGSIEKISFHPQQINYLYTKMKSDLTEELPKFGLYNQELEDQWLREADLIVIQQSGIYTSLNEQIAADPDFRFVKHLPAFCASQPESVFDVYQKRK